MADWVPPSFAPQGNGDPLVLRDRRVVSATPAWDPSAGDPSVIIWDRLSDWDKLYIDGRFVPAIVAVKSDKGSRIQQDQTPGDGGASARALGASPASVAIRLRFANPDDLGLWVGDFIPDLLPPPGKPPSKWWSVTNPALNLYGIRTLILESASLPEVEGPGGWMVVTTRWLEWLPTKSGKVTTILGSSTMGKIKKAEVGGRPKTKPSENP